VIKKMADIMFGFWTWDEIVNWYSALTFEAQILVVIGICASLALLCVGLYYLIKGVIYLVYYVILGVAYLMYALFFALFKLFEALYYGFSGKPRPPEEERVKFKKIQIKKPKNTPEVPPVIAVITPTEIIRAVPESAPLFCTECGNKLTDSMKKVLTKKGAAFCPYCGKVFQAQLMEVHS